MEREERRRFAMIKIALVIGLAFVIQFVLSSFQMKNFNNEFVRLRRKGKVAIGRKSGGFHAGAIVMFRIDEKAHSASKRESLPPAMFLKPRQPGYLPNQKRLTLK